MYPPDHDFIFFRVFRFLKIFFINISMKCLKPKQTFCIRKHLLKERLNVLTALGHMLMPSAQRWETLSAAGVWLSPPCPDYKTPISGDCFQNQKLVVFFHKKYIVVHIKYIKLVNDYEKKTGGNRSLLLFKVTTYFNFTI